MSFDLPTLRHFFAAAPFVVDLGLEPLAVEPGHVTTALPIQPRFLQHTGVVHAGVTTSLADHSMGAAAQTQVPEGSWAITADLHVSMLRAAKGERLVCEARVVKAGRQLTFTEAEVFAESAGERTLVAKATATMAIVAGR